MYCKHLNKEIKIKDCTNCLYKEYPLSKNTQSSIQKKSKRLTKLERNRTSLFTDDLDHCIICGARKDHLHEVFFGANRQLSMKYQLVIPLCSKCHREMHKNIQLQDIYHKKGQVLFNRAYPDLDFCSIFHRNYL